MRFFERKVAEKLFGGLIGYLADLVRILFLVVFSIELIHFGLKVGDGVIYTAGNEFIKVTYGTVRAVCGVLFPRVIKVLIDLEIQTFF